MLDLSCKQTDTLFVNKRLKGNMEEKQFTVVISARVPSGVAELLEQRAGEQGKSSSDLLRYALSLILLPAQTAIEKEKQWEELASRLQGEKPFFEYLQGLKEDLSKTIGEHERILSVLKNLALIIEIAEQGAKRNLIASLEEAERERITT